MKKFFLLPALLIVTFSSSIAQDFTWFGGVGSWDVSSHWIPNGVPGFGDEVLISKGKVIIENGTNVTIQNLEIGAKVTMVIEANGDLHSTNSIGGPGILNYGKIINNGAIISNNHTSIHGNISYGIKNHGHIENKASASINITNIGHYGCYNSRHASLVNKGELHVLRCKYLARNYGSWTNEGLFTFENASPRIFTSNGFANYNQFTNAAGGVIRGQDFTYGITSRDLYSTGQFENSGKIVLSDADEYALTLSSDATNDDGGNIHLRDSRHGLNVQSNVLFINDGYVSSTYQHNFGILVAGHLENNGRIQASNNVSGILLQNAHGNALFDNHGEVDCFGNSEDISSFYHDFINHDDGEVLTQSFFVPVGITNHGIFRAHFDGYIDENNGSVINHGIIEDLHGILPGLTNHQCVLRPLDGPLVDGVIFPNATNKASFSNSIIALGWYDQLSGGNAGGLFFSWNNNLFPNAHGAAANALYMTVKIKSSGLTRTLKVLINGGGGSLKKDAGQNDDQLNDKVAENIAPIMYPNPFSSELNINMVGNWNWECRDINGKVWAKGSELGICRLNQLHQIPRGTYIMAIKTHQGKRYLEQITKVR